MSYLIHANELCFAHVFEARVNNAPVLTHFEQARFKHVFIIDAYL